MKYLFWKEQKITDLSPEHISVMYDRGFVFTRLGKGVMQQTRSCRINLEKFSLTSENRRIIRKADLGLVSIELPLGDYDFSIGKTAKDFYDTKFGKGIMSVQKVKEMLTNQAKSNFNTVLRYSGINLGNIIGHTICYMNKDIMHYSYPFYDLVASKDTGLGMMTTAVSFAKDRGLKYVYLGSLQRPTDTYKLQFEGLEWFDGKAWQTDLDEVKKILKDDKMSL
jgi:arginyl-tRNA--protein-N-Asp/Glu arginylyltransferase